MKRTYTKFLYTLLMTAFAAVLSQPVWAARANTPANYLVDVGRMELQNGKVNDAIHEFKKALLIDPAHEEAKAELKKLGVSDERYQGVQSSAQRAKEYQDKIAHLEKDKADMQAKFDKVQQDQDRLHEIYVVKNLELEVLINKVAALKQLREKENKQHLKTVDQVAEFYTDQNKDLKNTVQKQKKEIVNQQIALLMPDGKKSVNEAAVEDNLLNLGYRVNQLDPTTQAKMEVQEKLIQLFSEYLDLREQRFLEVENRAVTNEIDKAKQAKMLVKKMDEIIKLQDNVDRYLSRLEERDELITDKNKENELIENELYESLQKLDDQNEKVRNLEEKLKNQEGSSEAL
jgi:hypothetical protein